MTRLYRFFNLSKSAYGEPFAMCDECKKSYRPPAIAAGSVIMIKVADRAVEGCCSEDHKPAAAQRGADS